MTEIPVQLFDKPFGSESRTWILEKYFQENPEIHVEEAWKHVYRLLLWIDETTGLAHCYESDKSQPGRHWYSRSLLFHKWVSEQLGYPPRTLHANIDYLFRWCTRILAAAEAKRQERRLKQAEKQRAAFAADDMPVPGENPELEKEVAALLADATGKSPSPEIVRLVVRRVQTVLRLENKRKNLVGEGFEDVLKAILSHVVDSARWEIQCRKTLHDLPGFREPPQREKPRTVDLAIVDGTTGRRILGSVKWSVRADREEQFGVDYEAYSRNESAGERFDFVFITNEFDAARLVSACDRRYMAQPLFSVVVHVQPDPLMLIHGESTRGAARRLQECMESGRLLALKDWVATL